MAFKVACEHLILHSEATASFFKNYARLNTGSHLMQFQIHSNQHKGMTSIGRLSRRKWPPARGRPKSRAWPGGRCLALCSALSEGRPLSWASSRGGRSPNLPECGPSWLRILQGYCFVLRLPPRRPSLRGRDSQCETPRSQARRRFEEGQSAKSLPTAPFGMERDLLLGHRNFP